MAMPGVLPAAAAAAAQAAGYVGISSAIQSAFYGGKSWWPLLSLLWPEREDDVVAKSRPGGRRHEKHALFATINSATSSACAGFVAFSYTNGNTSMVAEPDGWTHACVSLALAVALQSLLEYWWHRLMHFKGVYKTLHKLHHTYQSPVVWDDLFIHPLEAVGYYVILYCPAFAIPRLPLVAFFAYMAIMGLAGVVDHAGVASLRVPCLYESADHATHHARFTYNYAFPFPLLDIVHNTYAAPSKPKVTVHVARPGELGLIPEAYFATRFETLRAPVGGKPGSERLPDDAEALHVWLEEGGAVVAVARAHVIEGDGAAADHAGPDAARIPPFGPLVRDSNRLRPAVQVRQMGVLASHRSRGMGSRLLARLLEESVACFDARTGFLQARAPAIPFYAREGWSAIDDPYSIRGVGPHRSMAKALR